MAKEDKAAERILHKEAFQEVIEDFEIEIIKQDTQPALARAMHFLVNVAQVIDQPDEEPGSLSPCVNFPRFLLTFMKVADSSNPEEAIVNFPYDLLLVYFKQGCHPMGLRIFLKNANKEFACEFRDLLLSNGKEAIDFIGFDSSSKIERFTSTLPHICIDYKPIVEYRHGDPLTETCH